MPKHLLPLNWATTLSGEVIDPLIFRGSELVGLKMSTRQLEITFVNRGTIVTPPTEVKIIMDEPVRVRMDTDHLQNIVSTIYLFERTEIDKLAKEKFIDFISLKTFAESSNGRNMIVVVPTSGIDFQSIGGDVRIYSTIEHDLSGGE